MAEACERDRKVVSFESTRFSEETLEINKNNNTKINLLNFNNRHLLIEIIYEEGLIDELDYCKFKFVNSNLSFDFLEEGFSFNILSNEEKKMFISTFRMFSEMSWDEILNHDGLDYKQYILLEAIGLQTLLLLIREYINLEPFKSVDVLVLEKMKFFMY